MAKRGAENQITKDDDEDDRFSDVEEGVREQPLKPVAGRVIRGLPKRAGGQAGSAPMPEVAQSTAPTPAPAPTFGAPAPQPATIEAPKTSAFGGFSFGAPAVSTTPAPAFTFGASSNPAPALPSSSSASQPAKPFSGFSFGQTTTSTSASTSASAPDASKAASSPFAFGSKHAGSSESAPSTSFTFGTNASSHEQPKETEKPAAAKPFAAFSFGTKPAETTVAAPPSTSAQGFSFSVQKSSMPTGSAPQTSAPSAPTFKPTQASAESKTAQERALDPQPSQPTPPPEEQVSYYLSLRGLNSSILSFLSRTIEKDPLVDLSQHLSGLTRQYGEKLDEAATNAGWRPEGSKPAASVGQSVSLPAAPSAAAPPKPVAPAPVASSVEAPKVGSFSLLQPASTSSAPSGGGFTPSLPAAGASANSSPFSFNFGAKPAEVTPTATKSSEEVSQLVKDVIKDQTTSEQPKADASTSKTFTFGAPASSSVPTGTEKKSLFAFAPSGPLHPPTPESKTFTPSAQLESPSTPAKLGKFGPGGAQPQLAFGGAKTATPNATPISSKAPGFSFGFGSGTAGGSGSFGSGSGSAFSFGSTPAQGTEKPDNPPPTSVQPTFSFGSVAASNTDKPASNGFGFGSSSTPKASTGFSFGSTPASGAAPTFSFGSSTPVGSTRAAPAPAFTFKPTVSGSGESSQPLSRATSGGADGDDGDDGTAGNEAPGAAEPGKNLAESVGAGEEDEDTVLEIRAKLFKLDSGQMAAVGLGQLKLKKAKQAVNGKMKRRLLMRTDGGGNVILNMSLTPSFAPSAESKHIRFLGADLEGKPAVMSLMVKTADAAKQMADTMMKEVEELKKEGA